MNFLKLEASIATQTVSPLIDPQVNAVLSRLHGSQLRPANGGPRNDPTASRDPNEYAQYGFSIAPEQGDLIYLLCRATGARRAVEFASSHGISTLYLAAAVRDNGGGSVIGSEIVPEKVRIARRNLEEAGLARFAEIREGDARQTLRDLGGPVDIILIDGWPTNERSSLAMQVVKLVTPQLRMGGLMVNDNGEADYLEYIRDPGNGFRTVALPLKGSTEVSVKVGAPA